MNHIIVNGRLGRSAEKKTTQNGKDYYSFSVASNTKKGKEVVTVWYSCTAWNLSDNFAQHLKSGSAVTVVGSINPPRVYQSKTGENKVDLSINVNSVEFAPFGSNKEEGQSQYAQTPESGQAQPMSQSFEELPF